MGVALKVEDLRKRFGDLVAVDGLSLEVNEGEVFGLLGPNGAGKTTSLRMLAGLLSPDSGRALVFGEQVAAGHPEVRARVGVCPQEVVLWPRLTCLEQLVFMGEAYEIPRKTALARSEELLQALNLWDKRDELARALSGGMQRRLSILMALVHEPDIVVLDEPEAGLDPQSRVLVRGYIETLARKKRKTVLFTTHNMDEAERVVDRVAIVDHGRLLEVDTPTALKKRVGGGDRLELVLTRDDLPLGEETQKKIADAVEGAETNATGLVVRRLAVIDRLPAILASLQGLGLSPQRIDLRESSLEDVFLSLTGRSLRE